MSDEHINMLRTLKGMSPLRYGTALDAAIAALGGGWLPIESAPRDGTLVDLWAASMGLESRDSDAMRPYVSFRVCDAGWFDGEWRNSDGNSLELDGFTNIVFTHWRPLPAPPSKEG